MSDDIQWNVDGLSYTPRPCPICGFRDALLVHDCRQHMLQPCGHPVSALVRRPYIAGVADVLYCGMCVQEDARKEQGNDRF